MKRGSREDGDIKRETMQNFWAGAYAGREGVLKQEFPVRREAPSHGAQRRAKETQKAGQSRDSEGRKQTKLHFTAMVCDSDQTVGSGSRKKP